MRYFCPQVLSSILTLTNLRASSSFRATAPFVHSTFSTFLQSVPAKAADCVSTSNDPTLPPVAPTSKRLFLVRHGEVIPPGGVHGVFYGALDVPLSPLGELEAKAAASYLEQFDLEHVASSPLKRAIFGAEETLMLQSNKDRKEVKIYPGFSELDRGAWCGLRKDEIGEDIFARFDACDESVTPEGGESYPFLKRRVLEARDQLLSEMEPGRSSALVSHLQVTRSMLR